MAAPCILLVDDSEQFREALERALRRDYRVLTAGSVQDAEVHLSPAPDAVLLDLKLDENIASNVQSLSFLRRLREDLPRTPVIMVTAYGDVETAVECMRLGASDFIQKGGDLQELKARVEKALEQARVMRRLEELERELEIVEPRRLLGESVGMRDVRELVAAVARDARVTVLVTGETGTGKELVARAIHASGSRAGYPFKAVAVAALPVTTMVSELFGYEPGAFTDAKRRHIGLIEQAQGGVLFLDEIGELAIELQVKLLRFLEERVVMRLGGRREICVDLQVVAATNADLEKLVSEGRFREDLYYRLKVFEIHLPALRERREDIELLVMHYLQRLGGPSRGVTGVAPPALRQLTSYAWPGNVRELRNSLEAALLKAGLRRKRQIEEEDLSAEIRLRATGLQTVETSAQLQGSTEQQSLEETLARVEFEQAERALNATGGKKTEAWKLLGLNDRFVFSRRVRRLCHRFPDLAACYPAVRQAFGGRGRKVQG